MAMMDNAPYDFIRFHNEHDIRPIKNFKHRTFNFDDALFFIEALKHVYSDYTSLESLFLIDGQFIPFQSLSQFHNAFFTLPFALNRSKKHLSTPVNKSTCKRINMFLRWMVRYDDRGVDFGLWRRISPSDLLIPFDVHVERVALQLNLLSKSKKDWSTVIELTEKLKQLDPEDPIKYDFALFNLGVHAQDYPF